MYTTQFYLCLIVGVVMTLLIRENFGIICGGSIVCGYLAMKCDDFLSMTVSMTVAVVTYLIVEFVLPKTLILFGKRTFATCMIIGLLLKLVADFFVPTLPFETLAFRGIGITTPGLIANTCIKQGFHITILAVLIGTYITFGIVQFCLVLL